MSKIWYVERAYDNPDLGFWNDSKLLCKRLNEWVEDYKKDPWPDHDGPYPVEQWVEGIVITEVSEMNKEWMNPVTMDWDGDRKEYFLTEFLEKYDN